jgi:hypothetical protein
MGRLHNRLALAAIGWYLLAAPLPGNTRGWQDFNLQQTAENANPDSGAESIHRNPQPEPSAQSSPRVRVKMARRKRSPRGRHPPTRPRFGQNAPNH